MADSEENIFASDALFEEFEREEDEENGGDLIPADALGELQKEINAVCEENDALKRKLRVLSAPVSESVSETVDGPSVQVLFMNNAIATKYRQDVEQFFLHLMQKESERKNDKIDQAVVHPPPQRSSFALQLGRGATESESVESREVRQLYTVTGSVQFYQSYCVDHLGQPLIDGDAKISEGWDIPTYEQIYFDALSSDGQDSVKVGKKKDKPSCFNCGGDHAVRDCTQPRDHRRISQNRKLFMDQCGSPRTPSGNRYHADLDPKFTKFKPGVVSPDLMKALGVTSHQLPPFIYQMRKLGYPPGWLAEAEETTSGLSLYSKTGKKVNEEGEEVEDGELDTGDDKKPTYNTNKIVAYPGFNVPVPEGIDDMGHRIGLPMQPHQQREVLVSYLEPSSGGTKRAAEDDTPRCSKRQKREESDMDVDTSGTEDNCIKEVVPPPPKDGIFQPPLPPTSETATPPREPTNDSSASESEGTEKPLPCKESDNDTNSNVENRDEIIERTIGRKDVDSQDSDTGMEDWVVIDSESLEQTSDSPDVKDDVTENASLSSDKDSSQDMPEDYFSPKGLPHRSKFADGITPFVEKENLTELKGTFQKLLGVLKGNKKKK
ncbi:PREDICTED: zinc finger CCHC domain-containing protein 8-like [Branchiostoma belcheri]|uniref:Zinc finger CCHC domain-containing protein 8-like n=1 Tax=Branchiostoma belcheri TaxID=7741 RepID=A0A6P4Y0X2_BRABE|nr:PREDICTED: zinc finger CCHC domain-containing protein 8-like [Branchiostoma belcheri]